MQELISQLVRLYLPAGAGVPDWLGEHVAGRGTTLFDLASDGAVRAIVIPFDRQPTVSGETQWARLCEVANLLQAELGWPPPAVSVSGGTGFRLWLSFDAALPVDQATQLLDLLRVAYFPEIVLSPDSVQAPVELPPCLHQGSGKWAAFINPGIGASFADEPALDMPPPAAGQAALLQSLHSISAAQRDHALQLLRPVPVTVPLPLPLPMPLPMSAAGSVSTATRHSTQPPAQSNPAGLLLKDATLEDIVRHLHAKNIEPTFRHLLP
jgi:hypothetical protein